VYLSHFNQQVATVMRIASDFGFTPASRSRIFSFDQKNSLLLDNPGSESLAWLDVGVAATNPTLI